MKAIGPAFGAELEAAGLAGLPFSWGADGSFSYDTRITPQQKTAIKAVYTAHDPAQPPAKVEETVADLKALLIDRGVLSAESLRPNPNS